MSLEELFNNATVISVYTRSQAIEDGLLVDVTETAREAGFRHHTVVTNNVWGRCVEVPDELAGLGQDEQGRLWDVLWMASVAARRAPAGESLVTFRVAVAGALRPDGSPHLEEQELWLHAGPGDMAEPVLTIMFPEDY